MQRHGSNRAGKKQKLEDTITMSVISSCKGKQFQAYLEIVSRLKWFVISNSNVEHDNESLLENFRKLRYSYGDAIRLEAFHSATCSLHAMYQTLPKKYFSIIHKTLHNFTFRQSFR